MLRRFTRRVLAAVLATLALVATVAPLSAHAFGADAHTECCCPDPALCPVVNGEHVCKWKRMGREGPPPDDGPRLRSCSTGGRVAEETAPFRWMPAPPIAIGVVDVAIALPLTVAAPDSRAADAPEVPPPRSGSFVPS